MLSNKKTVSVQHFSANLFAIILLKAQQMSPEKSSCPQAALLTVLFLFLITTDFHNNQLLMCRTEFNLLIKSGTQQLQFFVFCKPVLCWWNFKQL